MHIIFFVSYTYIRLFDTSIGVYVYIFIEYTIETFIPASLM